MQGGGGVVTRVFVCLRQRRTGQREQVWQPCRRRPCAVNPQKRRGGLRQRSTCWWRYKRSAASRMRLTREEGRWIVMLDMCGWSCDAPVLLYSMRDSGNRRGRILRFTVAQQPLHALGNPSSATRTTLPPQSTHTHDNRFDYSAAGAQLDQHMNCKWDGLHC